MYERFTDRSRRVMQLANQEAARFNHTHIGTEHILLGLVKEGSGVGANVLKNLDVDLRKVRLEVEKTVKPGEPAGSPDGKLPQTEHARLALRGAIEAAEGLRHNYVGTEHLLLGLLAVPESSACKVLTGLGLTADVVRAEVLLMLGVDEAKEGAKGKPEGEPPSAYERHLTVAMSAASRHRDIQWWEKLCGVDAVASDPDSVAAWLEGRQAAASVEPQWTDSAPSTDGYYWHRNKLGGPEIVVLIRDGWAHQFSTSEPIPAWTLLGGWCGPIPAPASQK